MDAGTATSTLTLRAAAEETDPITIYLEDGVAYLREASEVPVAITTSQVIVDALSFTKYSNAPAPDSVAIDFTMSFNTENPQRATTKSFQTAITRVSAATFDSNLIPGADNTYGVGTALNRWTTGRFSGDVTIEGNTVIATSTNPFTEALYVWGDAHATGYLQTSKTSASGSPATADCDSDSERGRMAIDIGNNRLYVCNGASRGWDYVSLTN
jgi:hypothetical protein